MISILNCQLSIINSQFSLPHDLPARTGNDDPHDSSLAQLGLDADEIVNMKMEQNERKYPVEKAKGSAAKYDQL